MATIAAITFADGKLAKLCRGLNKARYDENPPTTVAEGEAFARQEVIEKLKLAFTRGDRFEHEDGFTPEEGIDPQL